MLDMPYSKIAAKRQLDEGHIGHFARHWKKENPALAAMTRKRKVGRRGRDISERVRRQILQRYDDGYHRDDIALELGVSTRAVSSTLDRAKRQDPNPVRPRHRPRPKKGALEAALEKGPLNPFKVPLPMPTPEAFSAAMTDTVLGILGRQPLSHGLPADSLRPVHEGPPSQVALGKRPAVLVPGVLDTTMTDHFTDDLFLRDLDVGNAQAMPAVSMNFTHEMVYPPLDFDEFVIGQGNVPRASQKTAVEPTHEQEYPPLDKDMDAVDDFLASLDDNVQAAPGPVVVDSTHATEYPMLDPALFVNEAAVGRAQTAPKTVTSIEAEMLLQHDEDLDALLKSLDASAQAVPEPVADFTQDAEYPLLDEGLFLGEPKVSDAQTVPKTNVKPRSKPLSPVENIDDFLAGLDTNVQAGSETMPSRTNETDYPRLVAGVESLDDFLNGLDSNAQAEPEAILDFTTQTVHPPLVRSLEVGNDYSNRLSNADPGVNIANRQTGKKIEHTVLVKPGNCSYIQFHERQKIGCTNLRGSTVVVIVSPKATIITNISPRTVMAQCADVPVKEYVKNLLKDTMEWYLQLHGDFRESCIAAVISASCDGGITATRPQEQDVMVEHLSKHGLLTFTDLYMCTTSDSDASRTIFVEQKKGKPEIFVQGERSWYSCLV